VRLTKCQRCESTRLADVTAKCSDCCTFRTGDIDQNGYVPGGMGIGGGDYVEMDYCLECGQIQGEWPVSPDALTEIKRENFADQIRRIEWQIRNVATQRHLDRDQLVAERKDLLEKLEALE